MDLATKVYDFYIKNISKLSDDKRFHFGTRLAAWRGEPSAQALLEDSYNYIVSPPQEIADILQKIMDTPQTGERNAQELRQPFFEKYPQLYGIHMALFRARHLISVYGIDARQALYSCVNEDDLLKLESQLLADDEAMKILSTFAINYCYLVERVIRQDEDSLPLDHFYDLGKTYDTRNIQQLQLLIYFYTHCIIGESNFYTRSIPVDKLPIYTQMLEVLEPLIRANFENINLDNKLEFLVCARICSFESGLFEKIYDECEQSISPDGTFVIDVHNNNIQTNRNDFVSSEHRNVLFIMSATPYQPHSTLVR